MHVLVEIILSPNSHIFITFIDEHNVKRKVIMYIVHTNITALKNIIKIKNIF